MHGGIIAYMAPAGSIERIWINAQQWGLVRLERLAASRRRAQGTQDPQHLATGLAGERAALFELRRRGYVIVAERWQSSRVRGDIDLVAWHGQTLCFFEIKARTIRSLTPAESAVDDDKRRQVRMLARLYLKGLPKKERAGVRIRFLVMSVYAPEGPTEFDLFEGAF